MPTKPIPEGFHSITPYLFAEGAARLIEFIPAAFEGQVMFQQKRPDGAVMHATIRIGDSMLMLADPTPEFGAMPSSIYLYVADCDAVYQRALDSGGVSVFPMMTLPSGQRYGGIKDPCGNIWWIPHTWRMFRPKSKNDAGKNSRRRKSRRSRRRPNQTMKPTAPSRDNRKHTCHDTLPWLISFSLGGSLTSNGGG